MGLIDFIKGTKGEDETKAFTLLSPDDIKANVPQPATTSGGVVQVWSSWASFDDAINRALNGWTGTRINYANELGDLRGSVLIVAAMRWAGINLGMGRLSVVDVGDDGKEKPLPDHSFTALMKRPNPEATGKTLWKQFGASWVMGGEFYGLMGRDGADRIREIWYEPNNTIKPMWDRDAFPEDETANDSIKYFKIFRDGKWIDWPKRDVFRVYDLFDPITRRGTNGIDSILRTLFTDQEREQYTALLLKHAGVTPIAIAPKKSEVRIDKDALAKDVQRRASGDDRAKPMVFTQPMDVLKFATDYSADAMEKIAQISESRVAAAVGISVQSLQFLVSQLSSTYNNLETFLKRDYQQWIIPTHGDFIDSAEAQILRDMDTNMRHELRFDYSSVPVMQPDKRAESERVRGLFKDRILNLAEAREAVEYEFTEDQKNVWYPVQATTLTINPIGEMSEDETPPETKSARFKKSVMDDAAESWEKHPALDEQGRELMGATEYVNGKAN